MRIKCAWCGFVMENTPDGPISHGICPVCKKKLLSERKDNTTENKDRKTLPPLDEKSNPADE